jgi:aspartyl-tRNA(Asn)/glutamyl-tRNA(Gln) amidotransferase subunit A
MVPLVPIADTLASLASGATTSLALTEAALERGLDPAGEGERAFTRVYDVSSRAAAAAADSSPGQGPLQGLPITIKDLFNVAGESTAAGSLVLERASPATEDAPVVARLRAAGAVIIGKTNMTEFAFSGLGLNPHFGTPSNPFDRARIPGGSSSGAGVAVPYGFAAASIGTDTGGSVRIPAAFCGLAGFKPTASRVPRDGMVPLSTSLDSVGPLAPTVACCALLDAVMAGETPVALAERPLAGLRLGLPTRHVTEDLAPEVAKAFDRALAALSAAGARIEGYLPLSLARLDAMMQAGGIAGPEAYAWHRDLLARRGSAYDPRVRVRLELGATASAADYIHALEHRRAAIKAFAAEIAGFDAILMPTVAILPPLFEEFLTDDEYHRLNGVVLRNPAIINQLDGCAVTIPIQAPGELPVGLTIAGVAGSDRAILEIGQAAERVLVQRP